MMEESIARWQAVLAVSGLILFLVWETVAPFFVQRGRLRHGARNVAVSLLNAAVLALVFAGGIVLAAEISAAKMIGLLYQVDLPPALHGAAAFLLLDVWTYWWHRLNHTVPFFWRFHRMHHSDPAMDVTTASRFHVGEISMSALLRMCLILLAGIPLPVVLLFDLVQMPIIFFHHANISLPPALDRALRYAIVTPFMHKVHHSRIQRETDSNYTSILSLWDRLFGSYREREDPRQIQFGLDQFDGDDRQSIGGMLTTPLLRGPS